ncbi:pyridoxamine 5'-phosphate oxidase family protein [Actinomadura sp. NEAU-AAG7]|uniref:pyridoxamine 5'-phosphate oxidase family protein n=1 Tax=Actinomadura sp. NEAU-AAG7 TaxID=2839640 RepID=UPI001BE42204|nr:pyridoxamine 5'-phosphate oxidase family protein [Actinomadura sp. NEAU-AAG7]MBT2212662.1 pyridoxamine 5'-phosphate oxidase family protein [Actinomadura sp. NEAU-AAG7]
MTSELEPLDPGICLALLQDVPVGRIAWAGQDGTVTVLPVNFAMDGDALVFMTAPGAKLDAVRGGRPLTFEADDLEPALRTAWSVLLTGPAEVVTDPAETERLGALPLAPWARPAGARFVRLTPHKITGRRIPLHPGGVTSERVDPPDDPG